jgi:hypothetical protein
MRWLTPPIMADPFNLPQFMFNSYREAFRPRLFIVFSSPRGGPDSESWHSAMLVREMHCSDWRYHERLSPLDRSSSLSALHTCEVTSTQAFADR